MVKTTICVDPETKAEFRRLTFPNYIKNDEARVRYINAHYKEIIKENGDENNG
jgi:hypothetical protein